MISLQLDLLDPAFRPRPVPHVHMIKLRIDSIQADSLTEEQVSDFKEAFSLFVSCHPEIVVGVPARDTDLTRVFLTGQKRRWSVYA